MMERAENTWTEKMEIDWNSQECRPFCAENAEKYSKMPYKETNHPSSEEEIWQNDLF